MAVVSALGSRVFDPKMRFFCSALLRAGAQSKVSCSPQNLGIICRSMGAGGKPVMKIAPSRHEWRIFKDQLHFYIMLGAIPLGGVILYSNIFIGQAKLTDIPEGYQPERWEYYKHPIQRWFARYIYSPPEKNYEINIHHLVIEQEKKEFKLLERKVLNMMRDRGDYKDWYYVDMQDRSQLTGKAYHEDAEENYSMPAKMKGKPS